MEMDHSQITATKKPHNSRRIEAAAAAAAAEEEEEEEEEEEITKGNVEIETLKNRIRGHDLFRLLVEKHMDCLKVSLRGNEDVPTTFEAAADYTECCDNSELSPDLDKLMKLHCMALDKLKEDMEIELQETLSFINEMYLELN